MALSFSKMHGLGNDFVVIDCINQVVNKPSLNFSQIADRHLGIGCDQILLIEASVKANFFCRIINSDGSEAEQCGNGLRCVARYVHENKLTDTSSFTIETSAGVFPIEIKDYDHIRVTIPMPDVKAEQLALALPEYSTELSGSVISIGNPHFIIQVDDIHTSPINQWGSAISRHDAFPAGVNVGFMQDISKNHIKLRTYERGAGQTHACGSNACAAVAVGVLNEQLANSVNVEFEFGKLLIEWNGKGRPLMMTGPACLVFTAKMYID